MPERGRKIVSPLAILLVSILFFPRWTAMAGQFFDALAQYDTFLRVERNLAPRTREAYHYDLTRFIEWLLARDRKLLKLVAIMPAHIKDYLAFLQSAHGYKSTTLCRTISSLRQFFRFCVENEMLESSPAEHIRNPKNPKKLPIFLVESELRKLLEAPDPSDAKGTRDYCILVMLGMTGVRLNEVVSLDVVNVDLENRTIRVFGKGRKERMIPLNELVVNAVNAYLAVRPYSDDPGLFLNRFSRRLSGRMIEKLVKQYCLRAGIPREGISPHKLRHTFATLLHFNDVDILEIQRLLGHASIVSTQIYTHTNTRRLRSAVDKISL